MRQAAKCIETNVPACSARIPSINSLLRLLLIMFICCFRTTVLLWVVGCHLAAPSLCLDHVDWLAICRWFWSIFLSSSFWIIVMSSFLSSIKRCLLEHDQAIFWNSSLQDWGLQKKKNGRRPHTHTNKILSAPLIKARPTVTSRTVVVVQLKVNRTCAVGCASNSQTDGDIRCHGDNVDVQHTNLAVADHGSSASKKLCHQLTSSMYDLSS